MHKLGSGWRSSSIKFAFNESKYLQLTRDEERLHYVKKTMESFISHNSAGVLFDKITISQQVQNSMEQYSKCFPNYIDRIVNQEISLYLGIVKFIVIFSKFGKPLPDAEKYTNFIDFTNHFCLNAENSSKKDLFIHFYRFIFSQQSFCDSFIQNMRMKTLIQSLLRGNLPEHLDGYCTSITTNELIQSLNNVQISGPDTNDLLPENFLPKLMKFTLEQNANPISIYIILTFLVNLLFKVLQYNKRKIRELQDKEQIKNTKINECQQKNMRLIDNFSKSDIFRQLDEFMKSNEKPEYIIPFYKILLQCTDNHNTKINDTILVNLIHLYKDLSVELKLAVLRFIFSFDPFYQHPFICDCKLCCQSNHRETFHLEQFCLFFIVENSDCFQVFARIIEKILEKKHPELIEKSLNKLISLIAPSSLKNDDGDQIIYVEIFQWIYKILPILGLTSQTFLDDYFFNEFIILPANETAIKFVKLKSFLDCSSFLIDRKRNKHRKQKLLRRMIELSLFDSSVQSSLLSLLADNFGPDILRFYIKNMGKPEFNNILDKYLPLTRYDFRNLFISANCFQLVNQRIDSVDFLINLLKLIYLIVNHTNDHFFDEWVLTLPKDSPLFKLNSNSIKNFIISSRKEAVIYIPSLIPLLDNYKYDGQSPFNYYLIGRYSVPIYEKLSIEHSYFPKLYSYFILSPRYIRPYPSMNALLEKQMPCYEFFPHATFDYLQIPHINVKSISFAIKFNETTKAQNCFMKFSGVSMYYQMVDKTSMIFVDTDFSVPVKPNTWIPISVRSKLFGRTEVSIDSKITTVNKTFEFDCLGNKDGIAFVSYVIDKNIAINNLDNSGAMIKPRGSVAFVPIHSIYDLMDTDHYFLEMIDMYIDNDETRNIGFLLSLSSYVKSSYLEHFFSVVISAIFRNIHKLCPENETKVAFWIPLLLDYINVIHDSSIKTDILDSFLFDIQTWKTIPVHQMKHFLKDFLSKSDVDSYHNNVLFTRENFLFSINISSYFDSLSKNEDEASLLSIFFSFWYTVSSRLNELSFTPDEIVNLGFTANINSLNYSGDISQFDVSSALFPTKAYEKVRTEILQFIFNLEIICKTQFFNIGLLSELSLMDNNEISTEAFNRLRERMTIEDAETISRNISVFSKIAQKFSGNEDTWLFFIEFLIKQKLDKFPTPEQIVLEHPKILPVFYMMLITLTHKIINLTHDISQKSLVQSLQNIQKSVISLLESILTPSKVDEDLIFTDHSLCYIYDLMMGKTQFDIEKALKDPHIESYIMKLSFGKDIITKVYQSIPELGPNWRRFCENDFANDDIPLTTIPNDYYLIIKPIFRQLILISLKNPKYFLNILDILLNVENIPFVQDSILFILSNHDVHRNNQTIIKYIKNYLYYLSSVRSEVYSKEFIDTLFSNCTGSSSFSYFNLLSYFVTYNDSFKFRLNPLTDDFEPFLRLLETVGPMFIKSDTSAAAIVAVKLILEGCTDELLNSYLHMFSTVDNAEVTDSPLIQSKSNDNISPLAEAENEPKSDRKHSTDAPNENKKLISSKISNLTTAIGPLFVEILCSGSNASQILEDRQKLENASLEFTIAYRRFKSDLINRLITFFFSSTKSANVSTEIIELSDTSRSDSFATTESTISSSTEGNIPIEDASNESSLDSLKKIKLNTISRTEQHKLVYFVFVQAARNISLCFDQNKFFFDKFNIKLRRKEYKESKNYSKTMIYKSQKMFDTKIEKMQNGIELFRPGKSWKFSPFISPFSPYKTVLPSNFTLRTPNIINSIEKKNVDQTLLLYQPTQVYTMPITNEYPDYIFKYSSLYHYPKDQVLHHIESLYGTVEMMMNCILIRLDLRVNSVIMKMHSKWYLLTDASCTFSYNNNQFIPKGKLNLHDDLTLDLCEDCLNGDFGQFIQFCGHFLLSLSLDSVLLSTSYISLNNPNSVYVNSIQKGSFIIEFLPKFNYSADSDLSTSFSTNLNTLKFPFPYSVSSKCKAGKNYLLGLAESKKKWQSNKMSNFEYLMRLNRYAQRSYCDLSSYPLLPRILMDFNQPEFPVHFSKVEKSPNILMNSSQQFSSKTSYRDLASEMNKPSSMPAIANEYPFMAEFEKHQQQLPNDFSLELLMKSQNNQYCFDIYSPTCRNLAIPVQIAASQTPQDFELYRGRMQSGYFYAENVSNPISVSGLNFRLSPFCRALWFLNDGWDQGSRNFISIQSSLSVTKRTFYEFPPEVFNGETLINWNDFSIQTGDSLNMKEYPLWNFIQSKSKSSDVFFRFAELHQLLLEMSLTKSNVHSWIDLMFGVKQNSIENYNVFTPLSYYHDKTSEQQRSWIFQCGRVPKQIFNKPHDQYHQRETKHKTSFDNSQEIVDNPENMGTDSSVPDFRQTTDPYSNLSQQQRFALLSYKKKNSPIEYRYKYDINKFKFVLFSVFDADESQHRASLNRVILDNDYSMLVSQHGISVYKNQKNSPNEIEKTIEFDSSCLNETWTASVSISNDKQYVAITNINNTVTVGLIHYEQNATPTKFSPLAFLNFNNEINPGVSLHPCGFTSKTVINNNQLVCATSLVNEVILWSISKSTIIWKLSFKNYQIEFGDKTIGALVFDAYSDFLFAAYGNTLFQVSLSGIIVRQISFDTTITCLSAMGFGFTIADRVLIVGFDNGIIRVIGIKLDDSGNENDENLGEFEVLLERKIGHYPIDILQTEENSYEIYILDRTAKFPQSLPK